MRWPWRPKETLIFNRPPGLVAIFFYKVITGIGEIVLGFLLLFTINGLIHRELAEDPQDTFVNFLLYGVHYRPETSVSVGNLFIFFGVLKLIIAISLWYRSHMMRKILILFLAMITSYSLVVTIFSFTPFRAFCFLADFAILIYLWKFLPRHFKHAEFKTGLAET